MARKQLLTDLLQKGHEQEQAFYTGLTSEDKNRPGTVDDWAAKDVIAHVAYWKQFQLSEIQKVMDGGSITRIDDFDHENAKIFERFSDQSWDEIMDYAEQATAVLTNQLQKMSEDDLELEWHDSRPIWGFIVANGYSHPIMHISGHYQQKGDMQHAAELTGMLGQPLAALDDSPRWTGTVHYNVACSYALLGDKEMAIEQLGKALALTPQLVEWSQQDPDLDSLRIEPAFLALYE